MGNVREVMEEGLKYVNSEKLKLKRLHDCLIADNNYESSMDRPSLKSHETLYL